MLLISLTSSPSISPSGCMYLKGPNPVSRTIVQPKSMYECDWCAYAQARGAWPRSACQGAVCVARVCLDPNYLEPLGEGRRDVLTAWDAPLIEQVNL